jgi:hypothetical protein
VTFINLLLDASASLGVPIYVVLTMRSDFLGDCTEFRGLPEAINASQYLIPRMTREERKEAINGPISVGGAEISHSLLTRLLNDISVASKIVARDVRRAGLVDAIQGAQGEVNVQGEDQQKLD